MKSVAIKDVKKLEIKEIEEPISEPGKIIIEVKSNGICGSDIHNWEMGAPLGLVMGHEFAGTVIDNGNSENFKVGDRVTALPISPCGKCEACEYGNVQFCPSTWTHAVGLSLENPGGLTSKISVREDMVVKVPDNVSCEEASMVEPAAVGLHAIHLADIKVGDKVLVVGGGIIGLMSALFAKKEGASFVALSETNESRGKKAVELSVADEWYDAKDQNIVPKLLDITSGGFDVIIECCGNAPAVSSALTLVKPGGKVILVGVSPVPITIPTVLQVMKELTVIGSIAYTKDEFKTCLELLESKQLDVKKFISKTIGLEEVQDAFVELTNGVTDSIKILVDSSK